MSAQQGNEKLNVVELFAGVGGFRLGLEAVHGNPFRVTLSNQFERDLHLALAARSTHQ
jgi:DNA (cytosine-5)-methyltransferase 1